MGPIELIHDAITEFDQHYAVLRGKVMEHLRDLAASATTDAEQVAHDAATAATPVIAEAKQDAHDLAVQAEADLTDTMVSAGFTSPPASPAPAPEVDAAPAAPVADVTTPAPPTA